MNVPTPFDSRYVVTPLPLLTEYPELKFPVWIERDLCLAITPAGTPDDVIGERIAALMTSVNALVGNEQGRHAWWEQLRVTDSTGAWCMRYTVTLEIDNRTDSMRYFVTRTV